MKNTPTKPNAAREALTRAVNRAIADGAPVYVNQPAQPQPSDQMKTSIDTLEGKLSKSEGSHEHAKRLITALGNPSEYEYRGECADAGPNSQERCACGQEGIRFLFTIHHPCGRKAIIGSTCINHFQFISPALFESLDLARIALETRIREAKSKAKRAAADAENESLWTQYAALRDVLQNAHRANRSEGIRSPRALWEFAEGWYEEYRRQSPPEYQKAGLLKEVA